MNLLNIESNFQAQKIYKELMKGKSYYKNALTIWPYMGPILQYLLGKISGHLIVLILICKKKEKKANVRIKIFV